MIPTVFDAAKDPLGEYFRQKELGLLDGSSRPVRMAALKCAASVFRRGVEQRLRDNPTMNPLRIGRGGDHFRTGCPNV